MHAFKNDVTAFNKEIETKADEAKAKLDELEAHAKHNAHKDESHAIAEARKLHAKIDSQRKELATAEESKAETIKTGIRGDITKLEASIHKLHAKLHPAGKAK